MTLSGNLQAALRIIGTTGCLQAADGLSHQSDGSRLTSLHLRRAGITPEGAGLIATALASCSDLERANLKSLSLSFNPVGDAGVAALVSAMPSALVELGLVGCEITDVGAQTVLGWAGGAMDLRMICIEGNPISDAMRDGFSQLGQRSTGLTVFV